MPNIITTKKYGEQQLPVILYQAWERAGYQRNRYAYLWANCQEDVNKIINWVETSAKDVKDKVSLLITMLAKSKFAQFLENAKKWASEQIEKVKEKIEIAKDASLRGRRFREVKHMPWQDIASEDFMVSGRRNDRRRLF